MFALIKFIFFAGVLVGLTTALVPKLIVSSEDAQIEELKNFSMDRQDMNLEGYETVMPLMKDHMLAITNLARSDANIQEMDLRVIRELAEQDPSEVVDFVQSKVSGDMTPEVEKLVQDAVQKAKEIVENDDLFPSPGKG